MRWAKVPEWLLDELVATDAAERAGVSPGTALAVFTALVVKHADWTTNRARATYATLGAEAGVAWRAAHRAALLLDAVGAVTVHRQPNRRGGQVANEFTLHLDRRAMVGTPPLTAVPTMAPPPANHGTPVGRETAGQGQPGVSLMAPLYPESTSFPDTATASQEEWGTDAWGLPEEVEQHALDESWEQWERLGRDRPKVRAMRAAAHPPEPGTRLQDDRGAPGSDAREVAGVGLDTTSAEGRA